MTYSSRQDELEQFKSQINLCDYSSLHGYQIDPKQSSRSSAILKHAGGDKLVVSRGANRHWKYFSVHDEQDQGTIIDFVQRREGHSLGEVRKELRKWVGSNIANSIPSQSITELVPSEHDVGQVLSVWEKSKLINGLDEYLQSERKISSCVLGDPIFNGRIRKDDRQNSLFIHHDNLGICGYEAKNRGFTGFSPGGIKGLFCSRPKPDDKELIVCETAIDALSYATLFGTDRKRFLSTAGQISPLQKSLLQSAAKKMPAGSIIVLAMDNDAGGQKLAEAINQTLECIDLKGKIILTRMPDEP